MGGGGGGFGGLGGGGFGGLGCMWATLSRCAAAAGRCGLSLSNGARVYIRHKQSIGHSFLEMADHGHLSFWGPPPRGGEMEFVFLRRFAIERARASLNDLQQTLDKFAVPQAELAEIKAIVASTLGLISSSFKGVCKAPST
jgi:hypothetical protein